VLYTDCTSKPGGLLNPISFTKTWLKKLKKVVLVTGDSSGIGHATCKYLASQGWHVFGASRRDRSMENWTHVTMDVTNEASVHSTINEILQNAGHLDAVVHCAGESFVAPIEDALIDEVQQHFNLNVLGSIRLLQSVLPHMRERRSGQIIVIGSIGGLIGLPFHGYYSAGKFALDGLVEALRPEVKPFGIDVAILHPGDINTEIGQNRVATANTDHSSPYHEAFTRAVAYYAKAEANGSPPDLVAREIARLLRQQNMPVRALAGKTIEKLGVAAKRLMLSRHFEILMRLAYGPGPNKRK